MSLFTNIPLSETINTVADYVFSDDNTHKPLMDKHIFVKLLRLASERLFFYTDCLYKQIDDVATGSFLQPTPANFFLAHMETKILNSNCVCRPKLNVQFVDDCFAVFNNDSSSLHFLSLLNSQHKIKKSHIKLNISDEGLETNFQGLGLGLGIGFWLAVWVLVSE